MTLKVLTLALAPWLLAGFPRQADDGRLLVARRLAATAQLAAQEYRLGVQDGRIIAPAEFHEATLFLTEARRTAGLLPQEIGAPAITEVDALLRLVGGRADPDTIEARVLRLNAALARRLGAPLEDIPAQAPGLARGAQIYQSQCAGCHGTLGRGDGPASAGLNPPPANLTDATALRDRSPLDFYHRVSLGVVGTAMPAFEATLSADDRWAAAVYASILRLPAPRGEVPPAFRAFATTARMTDAQVLDALAPGNNPATGEAQAWVAAVRSYQASSGGAADAGPVFARVRIQLDSAMGLASQGLYPAASGAAFDAYMTFERVERSVRARNAGLAGDLEASFAAFRTRASGGATAAELDAIQATLLARLENAERAIADRLSGFNLFVQSLVIMLREGLEAILLIGALMTFLMKTGAGHRKRDLNIGIVAAIAGSIVTAVVLETVLEIAPGKREALEGITMMLATGMLFYVSYWLLSKMEVAKWNRFVRGKVQDAVSNESALALASVAFLAVYREGFETVLFYKALVLAGGVGATFLPVSAGIVLGALLLVAVYVAINRFGVRIPLKPFFGLTSGFLYYMAFVFAGKGIAELQEGGIVPTTILPWGPRLPGLG
ncbi:MAG: FTR1 family protein, partial [Gemmatimonadales bacterium]